MYYKCVIYDTYGIYYNICILEKNYVTSVLKRSYSSLPAFDM